MTHKVLITINDIEYTVFFEEYNVYAQVWKDDTEIGLFCTFNLDNEIFISLFGTLYSIVKYDKNTEKWIPTKK